MEECTICFFYQRKHFELNDAVLTAYCCGTCWIYIALFANLKTSLGTRVFFLIEMPIILLRKQKETYQEW